MKKLLLLTATVALLAVGGGILFRSPPSLSSRPAGNEKKSESGPIVEVQALSKDDKLPLKLRQAATVALHRPQASDTWLALGDALAAQARSTLDTSRYALIERVYLRAHELDGENIQALVGLAWAAGAAHRFEDSVAWANLALKADPNQSAAHGILGDAAVELGRLDEAAQHYQAMLDLHPDLGSYCRAAHLLYLAGNVSRAMVMIRQAIAAAGGEPSRAAWPVAELASMLCREGAAPLAVKLVDDWLPRLPDDPTLLTASGMAHMGAGEDEAAAQAYRRAAELSPQHVSLAALYELAVAAGKMEEAQAFAERIEALHRNLRAQKISGGEGQLARFYADRGENVAESVRLAEQEYSHHRGAVAADTLAWAYFRAGRIDDAGKLIPIILRHRAPDAAALYHIGMIEQARGDTTAARRHLYAALSRQPRFSPIHAPLAQQSLERMGQSPTQVAAH